jgi:hypothetical protein
LRKTGTAELSAVVAPWFQTKPEQWNINSDVMACWL